MNKPELIFWIFFLGTWVFFLFAMAAFMATTDVQLDAIIDLLRKR